MAVHGSPRAKNFKFGSTIAAYFLELVGLKIRIRLHNITNNNVFSKKNYKKKNIFHEKQPTLFMIKGNKYILF